MSDCFISSASRDHFISNSLYLHLKNKQVNVWSSQQNKIAPGTIDFPNIIKKQINNSFGSVLLVSQAYLDSEFIVNEELPKIFEMKNKNKDYFIFPVLVEKNLDFKNFPDLDISNMMYVNSSTNALLGLEYSASEVVFDNIFFNIRSFNPKLVEETIKQVQKKEKDLKKLLDNQIINKANKVFENNTWADQIKIEFNSKLTGLEKSFSLLDSTLKDWYLTVENLENVIRMEKNVQNRLLKFSKLKKESNELKEMQLNLELHSLKKEKIELKQRALNDIGNIEKLFSVTNNDLSIFNRMFSHKDFKFVNENKYNKFEARYKDAFHNFQQKKKEIRYSNYICLRKVKYKTRKLATNESEKINTRHNTKVEAYKCYDCKMWHLSVEK
jgi:hypothetical protein